MYLAEHIIKELRVCTQVCTEGVHAHVHTFDIEKKYYKSYSYSAVNAVHVQVCKLRVHTFLFILINILQNCARAPYYVGKVLHFPLHSGGMHTNTHEECI